MEEALERIAIHNEVKTGNKRRRFCPRPVKRLDKLPYLILNIFRLEYSELRKTKGERGLKV